jgi:hypothetical protein
MEWLGTIGATGSIDLVWEMEDFGVGRGWADIYLVILKDVINLEL